MFVRETEIDGVKLLSVGNEKFLNSLIGKKRIFTSSNSQLFFSFFMYHSSNFVLPSICKAFPFLKTYIAHVSCSITLLNDRTVQRKSDNSE